MAYDYITQTGVIVPDTSNTLTEVQDEYKNALGADLVLTPSSPQGILITAQTLAREGTARISAELANQINPNLAGGVFLDSIGALTGLDRTKGSPSVIQNVTLTGISSTIIPVGTQARTGAGDIFESVSTVVITGGTATVNFQSVALGPIPAAIGALNQIVTPVLGWETVNNTEAAILGADEQSDQSYRTQRNRTLALQGVALPEAIISGLYTVPGVESLSFRENFEGEPMGALISVTGGATLSGTIWGMATGGEIVVGTDDIEFFESLQSLPSPNPWPVADYATIGNITLSGLGTQAGGDWAGSLTGGDIILVKSQTDESENGVWVAAAGSWTRQAYFAGTILGANDGLSLVKNSIFVCIEGGTDDDIATVLLAKKSLGCNWNGAELVNVVDPASGQTYPVRFDRPTEVPILIRATVSAQSYITDPETAVIEAIMAYINGELSEESGFVVGAPVSCFELAGAVNRVAPGIFVQNMETTLASAPSSWSNAEIPIALNQIATADEFSITVIIS